MNTCGQGHENPDNLKYCEKCDYPLNIPDTDKMSYLRKKMGGEISFDLVDNQVTILDIRLAKKFEINLGYVFPKLSNLVIRAESINKELLSELKFLRYLTLYLNVRLKKAKLQSRILELVPSTVQSLTITVADHVINNSVVTIPEDLFSYFSNLTTFNMYCNPASIGFMSEGHDTLNSIEILGESFEFQGTIKNFPSLTSIIVEYNVTNLEINLINLPNLDLLKVNLADNKAPIRVKSQNTDYELEIDYNLYY